MAGRGFSKKWWFVLVVLTAILLGLQVVYGWYRLIQDVAQGPAPPEQYEKPSRRQAVAGRWVNDATDGRAVVYVGSTTVMAFRSAYEGHSANERARHAARAIDHFLRAGNQAFEVAVTRRDDGLPAVTLNGQAVAVADFATAKANKSAPEDLAETWADNLRGVLREEIQGDRD